MVNAAHGRVLGLPHGGPQGLLLTLSGVSSSSMVGGWGVLGLPALVRAVTWWPVEHLGLEWRGRGLQVTA